ncbi:hypothetical protein E4U52_004869 [Claviceps spartinae]|nr:hypothetical protein E4U52_004869 [Claviceps spartinae]
MGVCDIAAADRLLAKAITKADDKTLWDEALTLTFTANHIATSFPAPRFIKPQSRGVIATQTSIPSINVSEHQRLPAATISPGSTVSQQFQSPSKYTTGSVTFSSEHRKDINLLNDFQQTAEIVFDQCKTGVGPAFNDEWDNWPDRVAKTEVVTWLKLFSDKLRRFSRASLSSDVSDRRSVLGMPKKPFQGSVAMTELDVGFVSAADSGMWSREFDLLARTLAGGELRSDPMADDVQ